MEKVEDAVDEVESSRLDNQETPVDAELRRLRRTFQKYGGRPLRVHDDFEKAMVNIAGALPDAENRYTRALRNLLSDLRSGVVDIRAAETEVDRAVRSRLSRKVVVSQVDSVERMAPIVDAASEESVPDLSETLRQNFEIWRQPLTSEERETGVATRDRSDAVYDTISKTARIEQIKYKESRDASREKGGGVDKVVDAFDKAAKVDKGAKAIAKNIGALWDVVSSIWDKFP